MSYNHVTCDCDHTVTDITLTSCFITCVTIIYNSILYFLSKFKIKKSKSKGYIRVQ